MLNKLKKELKKHARKDKVAIYQNFFKTGKGQYGEGDIFLGITVPNTRSVARKFKDLSFSDTVKLLKSKIHEERLCALLILVHNFTMGNGKDKKRIYDFYLKNMKYVNNWDLVDLSAHKIVGVYMLDKPKERKLLYKLVKSKNLWERRISVLATFQFIGKGDFKDNLKLAEILLNDKHDLMHKAVGWMLREIGKRDEKVLIKFLDKNVKSMPRTMLRYSIEKFPEKRRQYYLKK